MAIGRPDYFATPTTPQYGTKFVKETVEWLGLTTETITETFTFVGVFRELIFAAVEVEALDDIDLTLTIDGEEIVAGNLSELCASRWADTNRAFVKVLLVDMANVTYVLAVEKDIRVNTSVVVTIGVSCVFTDSGYFTLIYDEIEGS